MNLDSLIEQTKQLIVIPSTNNNPAALDDALFFMQEHLNGARVKTFRQQNVTSLVFHNTPKFPQNFRILLSAHLDVVHAPDSMFAAKIKGDQLFGRGAYDMKAAALVELVIFKELASVVDFPLGLQLTTDEEIGSFNGAKYQVDQGVHADFVLAGEPTNLSIRNKAKGIIWLKIRTTGEAAHGAYLWQGKNALWKMHTVLEALKGAFPIPAKEVWSTTFNLAKIDTANTNFNKVPDTCEAWLDFRFIPEKRTSILNEIKNVLPKDVELEVVIDDPAHYTDPSNKDVSSLLETVSEVTKTVPQLIAAHGGSDIRFFNQAGCDGVEFGPVGGGHHMDQEWVSISGLQTYYQVLKQWVLNLK